MLFANRYARQLEAQVADLTAQLAAAKQDLAAERGLSQLMTRTLIQTEERLALAEDKIEKAKRIAIEMRRMTTEPAMPQVSRWSGHPQAFGRGED